MSPAGVCPYPCTPGIFLVPVDQIGAPPAYESMFKKMMPCESGGSGTSTPSAIRVISLGRFNEVACQERRDVRNSFNEYCTFTAETKCNCMFVVTGLTLIVSSAPKTPYHAKFTILEKKS